MWESWRRRTDFYNEGLLIWLEADVLIRQKTQGKRSLDDFCKRFHGGQGGAPRVVPYTFEDVVTALDLIAPHDWRAFFETRLESLSPRAPLGGITQGGWNVTYKENVPGMLRALESAKKYVDLSWSIGIRVKTENGMLEDVIPGSPAANAGLAPGMKLVAVNGRRWSKDVLRAAVRATAGGKNDLELITENNEYFRTSRIDYKGGERYPNLERDTSKPDLLGAILKPLTQQVPSMTQKN
jgi:predicted metalloprotease with PDZ domain